MRHWWLVQSPAPQQGWGWKFQSHGWFLWFLSPTLKLFRSPRPPVTSIQEDNTQDSRGFRRFLSANGDRPKHVFLTRMSQYYTLYLWWFSSLEFQIQNGFFFRTRNILERPYLLLSLDWVLWGNAGTGTRIVEYFVPANHAIHPGTGGWGKDEISLEYFEL